MLAIAQSTIVRWKYSAIRWYQRTFRCSYGQHMNVCRDGSKANFCGICGKQLNPNALRPYRVALVDGMERDVDAVNYSHARSLVIYGRKLAIEAETGIPVGEPKVHPRNIISVTCLSATDRGEEED